MGMSDSQFKAFLRFLLDDLIELEKMDDEQRKEKLRKIVENIQRSLED